MRQLKCNCETFGWTFRQVQVAFAATVAALCTVDSPSAGKRLIRAFLDELSRIGPSRHFLPETLFFPPKYDFWTAERLKRSGGARDARLLG